MDKFGFNEIMRLLYVFFGFSLIILFGAWISNMENHKITAKVCNESGECKCAVVEFRQFGGVPQDSLAAYATKIIGEMAND